MCAHHRLFLSRSIQKKPVPSSSPIADAQEYMAEHGPAPPRDLVAEYAFGEVFRALSDDTCGTTEQLAKARRMKALADGVSA